METLRRTAKLDVANAAVRPGARGRRGSGAHSAGTRRPWWWNAAFAAILASPLGLAACDDSKPVDGGSSTPSSLSAPSRSARGSAEQQALAAYEGMWRAYAKAGMTANADEPDLVRYASGRALTNLKDGLAGYDKDGQILKGDLVTHPQVAGASPEADPQSVTVIDCLDDTKFLVYKRSGERADDEPGGRHYTKATVTNLGTEGWKVTSFGVQAGNTC